VRFEFSAGGIVFKQLATSHQQSVIEVLLCQHSKHHGWVFPKGLIGDHIAGEGKEETAIREVEEETGAKGKILKTLTPTTYWYFWEGEKVKKTVYYYLMEFIGGDITNHDNEMEDVEWLPIEEVEKRLSYQSDKKVWKEARKHLASSV
jgi:8-oxo-dGTP diphosphatase